MWSKLSTESLARATALHPMRVIAVWVVALIVTFGLVVTLFNDALTTEFTFLNGAESKRGETLLQERLQGPESIREVVLVRSANLTVDDPAFKQFAEGIFDETLGLGSNVVASATNYYQTRDESLVSSDRRSIILPLVMAGDFKDAESNVGLVHEVLDRADASSEFEVFITGESTFSQDFTEGAQKDAETGEAFGVPHRDDHPGGGVWGTCRGGAPYDTGNRLDRDSSGASGPDWAELRATRLRPKHDHNDRAGGGDRLLLVCSLPLS